MTPELNAHLKSGITTVARCWAITRADGVTYGFTDHDRALAFEGLTFKADSGMSAVALQQSTGLAVDNTEALGALSDAAITEEDISSGRFDNAEVRAWLVNWTDVSQRWLQFRGAIGELRRAGGAFRAELRGLTEGLNRPLGRVFQKPCTAVLGDRSCRFKTATAGYDTTRNAAGIEGGQYFRWTGFSDFEPGWFTRGQMQVQSGAAKGLTGLIKQDRFEGDLRTIELWQPLGAPIVVGDRVRLVAGCDKRMETCRLKFNNLENYQGFPDMPSEDWFMAVPNSSGPNTGGSRR